MSQHFPPIPESLLLLAEQQFLWNSAAFAGIELHCWLELLLLAAAHKLMSESE
jgi:hypothetical protein